MQELSKNICFQYFSGSASPLQRKIILDWLNEDESNKQLFYAWLSEWEEEHLQFIPDEKEALFSVLQRIDQDSISRQFSHQSSKSIFSRLYRSWWIAAAVCFIVFVCAFYFEENIRYVKYETVYGEVKSFQLPDNSTVILNAHSELLVPRWGFENSTREVVLRGEAAFSVVHTKTNKKFIVHTEEHIDVEVLGTEFSVYSRNSSNKVELFKGSVKLLFNRMKPQSPVFLKPGDIVSVGKEGKLTAKRKQAIQDFIPWKEKRFVFDATPMSEVVVSVMDFFGNKIRINGDELKSKKITGSFRAESAHELLLAFAEMFQFDIQTNSDSIVLTHVP